MMTMTKISKDVLKKIEALSQEKRQKVEAVVRRHLAACERMDVQPDSLDRVWIESIEAVEIDEHFNETMDDKWPVWQPQRSYDVYSSPADTRL